MSRFASVHNSRPWIESGGCIDYPDPNDSVTPPLSDCKYSYFAGRLLAPGWAQCMRCGGNLCHEHPLGHCPDGWNTHEYTCISNHDVKNIIDQYYPGMRESMSPIMNEDHFLNHIGDEIYKTNNALREKMWSEEPNAGDSNKTKDVDKYRRENHFYDKLLPEAIDRGIDRAKTCSNPYLSVFFN